VGKLGLPMGKLDTRISPPEKTRFNEKDVS
jgi:hypothetical protein